MTERLGALNWNTNEGASSDGDTGSALRNWELPPSGGNEALYFSIDQPQDYEAQRIWVFYSWRSFPAPRLTKGDRHYEAAYVQALAEHPKLPFIRG